ncbi:MAG: hypothetical protein HY454_01485 [Parcubacteria group bacterium]|nr:hypothetical protein [Parcubacteria group bacterium]
MNSITRQSSVVTVPKEVFDSMAEAHKKWGEFVDKFDDFIMVSDKKFIAKMNRARREHKKGKVGSWESLKKELRV